MIRGIDQLSNVSRDCISRDVRVGRMEVDPNFRGLNWIWTRLLFGPVAVVANYRGTPFLPRIEYMVCYADALQKMLQSPDQAHCDRKEAASNLPRKSSISHGIPPGPSRSSGQWSGPNSSVQITVLAEPPPSPSPSLCLAVPHPISDHCERLSSAVRPYLPSANTYTVM